VAAVGAVIAAVVLVALILFGGGSGGYEVTAKFINAGQIVKGNPVQSGGVAIGSVKKIEITPDGQAQIKFSVKDQFAPLRVGTRAQIKQFSQSGIANRYVDLTFPDAGSTQKIDDGGTIDVNRTTTAVDLDQLFDTLDTPTRKAIQDFIQGSAQSYHGVGPQAYDTFQYLNPALSTSSRLFNELTKDQPLLERFLVDSSDLVTTLASRKDDLAGLIGNLNDTTRALGNQKTALAASIGEFPGFMRQANTTFVNLRAALNDVDPLVAASKPVAKQLVPFLSQTRSFTARARPTVADLRVALHRKGADNDLTELLATSPALADIATTTKERNGKDRPGALPQSTSAFKDATKIISEARPYTTDFLGWLDDFSTTGGGFDALGAYARASISLAENLTGGPPKQKQFKRCPGAGEGPALDGSNVLSAEEKARLDCSDDSRAVKQNGVNGDGN
jgi:phospholipid/cholesterol/gamma-HCH transport system substrate-binding protein